MTAAGNRRASTIPSLGSPKTMEQIAVLSWRIQVGTDAERDFKQAPAAMLAGLETVLRCHDLPFVLDTPHCGRAAAGLGSSTDPVLRVVLCGLKMLDSCRPWHLPWPVQLGIHFGTVRAGTQPEAPHPFHLSGAAVTAAEGARNLARPNRVTATSIAWRQVRGDLRAVRRGEITVPGAGTIAIVECAGTVEDHHH